MNHDTKSRLRLLAFTLGTATFASFAIPGCATQADELCDIQCDCVRCSDRARDECGINANANEDRAGIFGCDPEFDEYIQCALEDNDCDDNRFEIDSSCDDEFEDLSECIADNSDIIGNSPSPSSGSGSGSGGGGGGGGGTTVVCDCDCTCADTGDMNLPIMGAACDPSQQDCSCPTICDLTCGELGGTTSSAGACR